MQPQGSSALPGGVGSASMGLEQDTSFAGMSFVSALIFSSFRAAMRRHAQVSSRSQASHSAVASQVDQYGAGFGRDIEPTQVR